MIDMHERERISDLLERFVMGNIGEWEFDDFISSVSNDELIEEARLKVISLPDLYPPLSKRHYTSARGLSEIKTIAANLVKG